PIVIESDRSRAKTMPETRRARAVVRCAPAGAVAVPLGEFVPAPCPCGSSGRSGAAGGVAAAAGSEIGAAPPGTDAAPEIDAAPGADGVPGADGGSTGPRAGSAISP